MTWRGECEVSEVVRFEGDGVEVRILDRLELNSIADRVTCELSTRAQDDNRNRALGGGLVVGELR